jgi:hypothetical protein
MTPARVTLRRYNAPAQPAREFPEIAKYLWGGATRIDDLETAYGNTSPGI